MNYVISGEKSTFVPSKSQMKRILYILLFCVCFLTNAKAVVYDDVKIIPNPKSIDKNTFVSNPDGILSIETVHSLNSQLNLLEEETSAEVAVVAVNSIGIQDIEGFANTLYNYWKVGKEGKDNGVLILFVLDQKSIRFEVGYGLEGALPDAICKRIQTQVMIPEFKNGNYDAGISAGVDIMMKIIKDEPVPDQISGKIDWENILLISLLMFAAVGLFSWLWLRNAIEKIGRNEMHKTNISRYISIQSHKNATLGFALFLAIVPMLAYAFFTSQMQFLLPAFVSSFGTLPVNIWTKRRMQTIRQTAIPCEACGGTMHILSEAEEDRYLSVSQQLEEQLHAVDYDVFECDRCKNEAVFTLDLPSAYSVCPECGTKAFIKDSQRVTLQPTYINSGMEEKKYVCRFCKHVKTEQVTIPRLQRPNGVVIGSGGSVISSGSGGFSSGSFGGGFSGGGGATSRW